MSDTQGASDLENDMPGLGAQPGNVRGAPQGLPSQLQTLVQRFLAQSQGPSNPKFLPPPPMQGGQQPKRPPIPSTDPPDPGARAFSPAPPGRPVPPSAFTPYIQPLPRDHDQWGQPEPYARLPASFELGGMYSTLGNYFSQHGGFASAPLGAGTAAFAKAYQDAYEKGMDFKMRQAKEQAAMHAQQLEDLERARSIEYADVFSRHSIDGDDPHDDIWRVAVQHGDKDVIAMMERGDSAEKVRRFLADHEAHIRALSAANKKQSEDDDAAALYGLSPKGQGGGAYDAYTNPTGTHGGAPAEGGAAPSAAAPGAGEVAGPGAPSGGGADTRAPALDPDKQPAEDDTPTVFKGVNPLLAQAAGDMYRGEEPTGMDKRALPLARALQQKMGEETDKIRDDPNLKPGQYVDAVRKRLGSRVADEMQGMEDYGIQPGSTSGYGKRADYLRGLESIILKDMPSDPQHGVRGWNAAYFHEQDLFRNNAQNRTIMLRTNDMASQLDNINNDLTVVQKKLEARGIKSTQMSIGDAVKMLAGDEDMNRLMSDLGSYSTAYNVVVSAGHQTLGGQQAIDAYFKPFFPLATIRNVIKGHVPSTMGIIQGMHRQWRDVGGKPDNMPYADKDIEQKIEDAGKMDTVTGAMPYGQVVNHDVGGGRKVPSLWTGRNQFDRNAKENWVPVGSTRD